MKIKKLPLWIKAGCVCALTGTVVFLQMPEEVSNLAFTPWWAHWFVVPAFVVFSSLCIIFNLDFVSNTDNTVYLGLLGVLWTVSVAVIFFGYGALPGFIFERTKLKKKKQHKV